MALVSPRHFITPFTNKTNLFTMVGLIILFIAFRLAGGSVAPKSKTEKVVEKSTNSLPVDAESYASEEDVIGDALENSSAEQAQQEEASKPAENSGSSNNRSLEDIEREMGLR